MNKESRSYIEYVKKDLSNPVKAAHYLTTRLAENDAGIFLTALGNHCGKKLSKNISLREVLNILANFRWGLSVKLCHEKNAVYCCRTHGNLTKKYVYLDSRNRYQCNLCRALSTKKYVTLNREGRRLTANNYYHKHREMINLKRRKNK